MHRTTLLYYLLAMLLSGIRLGNAQNDASMSMSEQSESSTTALTPECPFLTLSSQLDDSSSMESQPTETTTTPLGPFSTCTLPNTIPEQSLTKELSSANDIPTLTEAPTSTISGGPVDGWGTPDPTLSPVDGSNYTWTYPPPPSANLPSPPNSTSTLSLYADGPVSFCSPINVWWAGGVSPYTLYYMLLDPGQTFSDYTYEHIVSTQNSYGPISIVQLGDKEMRDGKRPRGLTRIRIEDATGTSAMAWVQNRELVPGTRCPFEIGGYTPKPPTIPTTVKFDDYTTVGSGVQITTVMVATIDGQPTTIFPTVIQGLSAQPGPNPSLAAPPRPTGGMQSGSIVHGSNGEVNVNNNPASNGNSQSGGQGTPGTIVQGSGHSSVQSGSGATNTGPIRGQAFDSASNPSSQGSSTDGTSRSFVSNSGVSATSRNSSIRNTIDGQASSTVHRDEVMSINALSSSSTIVVGVANATEQTGSGKNDYIVMKLSKRVFALIVALLVSAVLACAGFALFLHRKKRRRKSDSQVHFF